MKQTAVEWLFERLWDEPKDKFTWYALRKKAIEMEWEQMENAVSNGISKADMVDNRGYFNFDKWYNETYGGDQ